MLIFTRLLLCCCRHANRVLTVSKLSPRQQGSYRLSLLSSRQRGFGPRSQQCFSLSYTLTLSHTHTHTHSHTHPHTHTLTHTHTHTHTQLHSHTHTHTH